MFRSSMWCFFDISRLLRCEYQYLKLTRQWRWRSLASQSAHCSCTTISDYIALYIVNNLKSIWWHAPHERATQNPSKLLSRLEKDIFNLWEHPFRANFFSIFLHNNMKSGERITNDDNNWRNSHSAQHQQNEWKNFIVLQHPTSICWKRLQSCWCCVVFVAFYCSLWIFPEAIYLHRECNWNV